MGYNHKWNTLNKLNDTCSYGRVGTADLEMIRSISHWGGGGLYNEECWIQAEKIVKIYIWWPSELLRNAIIK